MATTPAEPFVARSGLLELLDAESRLLAQAVGERLPLELVLGAQLLGGDGEERELWGFPGDLVVRHER